MMASFSLFIFWLTSAVAIIQNRLHSIQIQGFLPELDDETFSDMIETLKMAEAENKAMEEKRVDSFSKGVQRASISPNGTFSFPVNCTPTNQTEGYPYCFHGALQEGNTTKANATVGFFDLNNPANNTDIGFTAIYRDGQVRELDVEACGQAELISYGNKSKVAASVFLATHVEELSNPAQLGIMRNSFVAKVHVMLHVYSYLVMDVESIPVQSSNVFAGKPFNVGFNLSASYERDIKYGVSAGASLELSLRTVKNALHEWNLVGKADAFVKTPISTFHFPYTYISADISI